VYDFDVGTGSGAVHRDEARAEALHAGEVLVAGRLVDGALASELGLERLHETQFETTPQSPQPSQTSLVDDDALVRVGELPRLRRRRFSAAQVWS
jgi:hypothetical protein